MSSPLVFDPENWVVGLFRSLLDYIKTKANEDYNVIGNFPPTELFTQRQPIDQTIIHFEADDVTNRPLGFGDGVVDNEYDDVEGTLVPYEAKVHIVNYDVGIWASEPSGGDTSRMLAYQLLNDLFTGVMAYNDLLDNWGIETLSFSGGNFIQEEIDDVSIWRVTNMTLVVRVFSKHSPSQPIPYIDDAQQIQDFTINPEGELNG